MSIIRPQSVGEEIANSISHGVGELLAISGLVLLVVFAALNGSAWHIVSFSIFGATMVIMYLFSTLTHSIQDPAAKDVLLIFDHAGIYLLIAGTYTPFCLIVLHGTAGWVLFGIEWGLAIMGIVLKAVFSKKLIKGTVALSTAFYAIMGWAVMVVPGVLIERLGVPGFIWLLAGGLCYTVGIVFFVWHKMKFHHLIWHLFVIVGTICHFFAVLLYVLPIQV